MAIQRHEHNSETLAWIETKITKIGEKDRALYLDFCGEISLLGLKDKKRSENLRSLASRALHRQLGAAAIESLNKRGRKIAIFAFAESQPDYSISECLSEFMPFLEQHKLLDAQRCDVHCIKKGAWVSAPHPSVVLTKLISSSVVILPVDRLSVALTSQVSDILRQINREPVHYESRSSASTTARRCEPLERVTG